MISSENRRQLNMRLTAPAVSCLYSITTSQAAILNLFRVINREARGYPHERSHLVALRTTKITAQRGGTGER
jgi:hypothetical protein